MVCGDIQNVRGKYVRSVTIVYRLKIFGRGERLRFCMNDYNKIKLDFWLKWPKLSYIVVFGATFLRWAITSSFMRFLYHAQRRTTVGRTPLDEWSARRRDLYLPTRNTHNRQTSMPPGGIRTHNIGWRAAGDLRLRRRGQCDRLKLPYEPSITLLTFYNMAGPV